MVEFSEELRHFCRNPRCRSKLPKPVGNPREAFCARGCHSGFYRKRCLVCEEPIEQPKTGQRKLCKKPKCKQAWDAKAGFGRYASSATGSIAERPVNAGVPAPANLGRGWRIVAGELTPSQLHCATVPDGPDCGWRGGAYEQLERRNRAALEAHFDALDAEYVAQDTASLDAGLGPVGVRRELP